MSSQIDENLTVRYGARANEDGYREVVQSLAAFVASDFSNSTTENQEFYKSMAKRSYNGLTPDGDQASGIRSNHMEFVSAQRAVADAKSRYKIEESTLNAAIDGIEGVDKDAAAVKLLTLRTSLEVSYQATSITLNMSLSKYL
jgi:hypothetical protein